MRRVSATPRARRRRRCGGGRGPSEEQRAARDAAAAAAADERERARGGVGERGDAVDGQIARVDGREPVVAAAAVIFGRAAGAAIASARAAADAPRASTLPSAFGARGARGVGFARGAHAPRVGEHRAERAQQRLVG